MKRNIKILAVVLLAVFVIVLFIVSTKKPREKSFSQEGIVCGSTIPAICHKYRCTTGHLNPLLIPDGGGRIDGTGLCDDGSNAQNLGEISH